MCGYAHKHWEDVWCAGWRISIGRMSGVRVGTSALGGCMVCWQAYKHWEDVCLRVST